MRMISRSISLICLLAVTLAACPWLAHSARAADHDVSQAVARLFAAGEKSTPPAIAAARSQYERLKRLKPQDPRVAVAFGLVLVNQHKYRDGLTLISNYLASHQDDIAIARVKIWAEIQDRQDKAALGDLLALARRFPAEATDAPDARLADTAQFLGTIFAYLDFARGDRIDADLKSTHRNEVQAAIGSYRAEFDAGREAVKAEFDALQDDRKIRDEQTAKAAEQQREKDATVLENTKTNVAAEQELLQSSSEELREAQRGLNVVQQQLASLNQDRTRLAAQIITVQAQLMEIQKDSPELFGPNFVPRNSLPATSINTANLVQASSWALTLATLNKQAYNMDRQIVDLRAKGAALVAKGAKESRMLGQGEAIVRKNEKQAKAIEKKLARSSSTAAAKTPALTAKMTSLSTYYPFPYEQETKRILSWFEE